MLMIFEGCLKVLCDVIHTVNTIFSVSGTPENNGKILKKMKPSGKFSSWRGRCINS